MADREWPYIVRLEAGPGALLYFGSRHTRDPNDPQIGEMRRLWSAFRPTVAVTENRGGFYLGGLDGAVRALGEFGAVMDLAATAGVPVWSLEPAWEHEVAEVTARFDPAEATLFYTLRVFLSERGGRRSRTSIDRLTRGLLKKRGSRPGLAGSLPTLEAMDSLWRARFTPGVDWRYLPRDAVGPGPGAGRLREIARHVNDVRDRHAARVILDLVLRGERVFAVAGGSHVVKQEPVLLAGLRTRMP